MFLGHLLWGDYLFSCVKVDLGVKIIDVFDETLIFVQKKNHYKLGLLHINSYCKAFTGIGIEIFGHFNNI